MSFDDAHIRFLARSQDSDRWGGEAPVPELDVEGALASVLARAEGGTITPIPFREPEETALAETGIAQPRSTGRWTRFLAAALLLVGGLTPWLNADAEAAPQQARSEETLAGVSTAAVVYWEHSGGSLNG